MELLHIDSSIQGEQSVSRTVTAEIVARWRAAVPGLKVTYRDLAAATLPHWSGPTPVPPGRDAERDAQALADFIEADVIVLGAPMYNFTVPTQLKAWIDRILVAGQTFRYTQTGSVGLAGGKEVLVAVARGGLYPPGTEGEHVETYLRHVFAFVGLAQVRFVRADAVAISAQHRQRALEAAFASIPAPQPLAA